MPRELRIGCRTPGVTGARDHHDEPANALNRVLASIKRMTPSDRAHLRDLLTEIAPPPTFAQAFPGKPSVNTMPTVAAGASGVPDAPSLTDLIRK